MKNLRVIPSIALAALMAMSVHASAVTLTMQDANFPTQFNDGGDFFNNGATELGMWANTGNKNTVAWSNLGTGGLNGSGGTARSLQVGDVFKITVSATRAYGQIGFSLNAGGTQGSSYNNRTSGSRLYFNTDNYGAWYVNNSSGNSSLQYVPLQDTYKDYAFTIRITSQTTADVYLTVDGTDYRAYNLAMNGSAGANISAVSIYGSDMRDGNSNENAYWKQTSTIENTGRVELGYYMSSGTYTPGKITDGLAANSTSTSSANSVYVGGNAGTYVILNQANTYTGTTTVNTDAKLEVQNASALGGTTAGTSVTSGGALSMYSAAGDISVSGEALTLNGTGVSGADGALRSTGGNNTWGGAITLGSNSRINADTSGRAGSLTISGGITGGANVLFVGANGANVSISGAISGTGNTQDTTTTSLYKDGANVLTLSGNNNYSGDTRIKEGNLTVASGGTLGSGSDVFIAGGASLTVNANATVASVQEWTNNNSGTIAIGSGATLTVNGADKGTMYQNSISGAGGVTMAGSGNSVLSLFGTQGYTGATTVSGGKISTGVALASSGVSVSGGTFEATAANILSDSATVTMNGGTYKLGGNETIGALSGAASGAAINLGSSRLTTGGNGTSTTFAGSISGTGGGLTKAGIGRLDLTGTSSYTGATQVSAGDLAVNGSIASAVTVASGATLSGSGTIAGSGATVIQSGGTHSPGNSPGVQTFSSGLTYNSGSTFKWELTASTSDLAARGVSFDGVNVTGGTLSINTGVTSSLVFNGTGSTVSWSDALWSGNRQWLVFDNASAPTLSSAAVFDTIAFTTDKDGEVLTDIRSGASFSWSTINQDVYLTYVVPEPSTYALLGMSALGLAGYMIRRRRR